MGYRNVWEIILRTYEGTKIVTYVGSKKRLDKELVFLGQYGRLEHRKLNNDERKMIPFLTILP